ncbi:MAG: RnfABCDGE type electron transport complex subunit B [Lentisphaerae bacterium]|nr:RnfABCDGE type electron transport complex subunit B [Lentisphaerota bacterium]
MGITIAVLTLGGAGLVCALILVVADRFFAVHEDPRIETLTALLPGVNCGACGFGGCVEYARALLAVVGATPANLCPAGGAETAHAVAAMLGIEAGATDKKVALVLCGGDSARAPRRFLYNGVADCAAAHAVGGGDKLCRHGCLGYGSCARVCPAGAVEITAGQLALVHADLCIGCGACVKTCPRKLIRMIPAGRTIHVLCNSPEKGPAVKKACQVGCIGCTLCAKLAPEAIQMNGFLAAVDYARELDNQEVVDKCPTHCIVRR